MSRREWWTSVFRWASLAALAALTGWLAGRAGGSAAPPCLGSLACRDCGLASRCPASSANATAAPASEQRGTANA